MADARRAGRRGAPARDRRGRRPRAPQRSAGSTSTSWPRSSARRCSCYDEDELRARCRDSPTRRRSTTWPTRPRRSCAWRWPALVDEEGLDLDVASGGELHVALHAGFPPDRIVFHGNNKSDRRAAARAHAGRRARRRRRLRRARPPRGAGRRRARRGPGCSCGSRPASRRTPTSTSPPAPTTRSSASPSPTVPRTRPRRRVVEEPAPAARRPALPHRVADPRTSTPTPGRGRRRGPLRGRGARADGPRGRGAQPRRRARRAAYTADDLRAPVDRRLRHVAARRDLARVRVAPGSTRCPASTVEPGRSIAAPAGITLYRVGTVKAIPGVRTYVAVDGGMSDNPRPGHLRRRLRGVPPRPGRAGTGRSSCTVAGKHCEQGDVLVRDAHLPDDLARRRPARHAGHRRLRATRWRRTTTGPATGGRVRARRRRPGSSSGRRDAPTTSSSRRRGRARPQTEA